MKTESAELLALQLQAFPQAEAPEVNVFIVFFHVTIVTSKGVVDL